MRFGWRRVAMAVPLAVVRMSPRVLVPVGGHTTKSKTVVQVGTRGQLNVPKAQPARAGGVCWCNNAWCC